MEKSYFGLLFPELNKEFLLKVAPEEIEKTCQSDLKLEGICESPGFWFLKTLADLSLQPTQEFNLFFYSYRRTDRERYIRSLTYRQVCLPGSEFFISAFTCLKDAIKRGNMTNINYFLSKIKLSNDQRAIICKYAAKYRRYELLNRFCEKGRVIANSGYLAYLYRDGMDELADSMITSTLHRRFQKLRGLAMSTGISEKQALNLESWEICRLVYTLVKYQKIETATKILQRSNNVCKVEILAGLIRQRKPNLKIIRNFIQDLHVDSYLENISLYMALGKTGSVEIFEIFQKVSPISNYGLRSTLEYCRSWRPLFSHLLTYNFSLLNSLNSHTDDLIGFQLILAKMEVMREILPVQDKSIQLEARRLLEKEVLPFPLLLVKT